MDLDSAEHGRSNRSSPARHPATPWPIRRRLRLRHRRVSAAEGGEAGSGLFVNANSGRLEPTDAAIDLDAEPIPEDHTDVETPAVTLTEEAPRPAKAPKPAKAADSNRTAWLGGSGIGRHLRARRRSSSCSSSVSTGGSGSPSSPRPSYEELAPPQRPGRHTAPGCGGAGRVIEKFDLLQNGDFDKAAQAGIEQVDENDPAQLGHRGEFRWLTYLQKQRQTKAALNPADAAVTAAAADLQGAADKGDLDALFWLGHLQESTNATDKAEDHLRQGRWRNRRTRCKSGVSRPRCTGWSCGNRPPRPAPPAAPTRPRRSMLALVAFQAPPPTATPAPAAPAPAAAPADADEAGFAFWDAVQLARQHKYAEALRHSTRPGQLATSGHCS